MLQRLDSRHDDVWAREHLAWAYLGLNRYEEARKIFEQIAQQDMDDHVFLYRIAFVQEDAAAMQKLTGWAAGNAEEHTMLQAQSEVMAFSGKLQESQVLTRRALERAQHHKFAEVAASIAAKQALRDAEMGRSREARENAGLALRLARTRDPLMVSATALALAGDINRAQMLARELNAHFPADTLVQEVWLPLIGAGIELSRRNSRRAIELLHPVMPYDLSRDSDFLPNYLRGKAYLQAHDAADARQEFQKILNSRGAHPTSPVYVLAHLGLSRARAQMADVEGSRKTYEKFLAVWKDADPDIPILKQAKAEYAKLQ